MTCCIYSPFKVKIISYLHSAFKNRCEQIFIVKNLTNPNTIKDISIKKNIPTIKNIDYDFYCDL